MKLAYVSSHKRGEVDRIFSELADDLRSKGKRLAGVVKDQSYQMIHENGCDMKVRVLPGGSVIKITQDLGNGSDACRLDPAAIAEAVRQVECSDFKGVDLFLLNKFGPEEAAGRGFCNAIGKAMEHNIPVLVGVGPYNTQAFKSFAGSLARPVPADLNRIKIWCENVNLN